MGESRHQGLACNAHLHIAHPGSTIGHRPSRSALPKKGVLAPKRHAAIRLGKLSPLKPGLVVIAPPLGVAARRGGNEKAEMMRGSLVWDGLDLGGGGC